MNRVVIIGAGYGGLAAGLKLAKEGMDVTILESHTYAGGSGGTFYHQGFRFDAGATLAGGFAPGAPMDILSRQFDIEWNARPENVAMQVHLPDGSIVTRWTNANEWKEERIQRFGQSSEEFWKWQEKTADAIWQLSDGGFPWPPQNHSDLTKIFKNSWSWMREAVRTNPKAPIELLPDIRRKVWHYSEKYNHRLQQFLDAQLLISAQTTSRKTNALYGAAALDLPRLGVSHVAGGMGSIAEKIINRIESYSQPVQFRQRVVEITTGRKNVYLVKTKRGNEFPADQVIFNLPISNIYKLFRENPPPGLISRVSDNRPNGWGAFMLYLGVDESIFTEDFTLHQQIIKGEKLGEGNSIFISTSPAWDNSRAPDGYRAVTVSTHTKLDPWWDLFSRDRQEYEQRKEVYTNRILDNITDILPEIRKKIKLILPGTPVTFQRFTQRDRGWVGGYPQESLFQAIGPKIGPGLWMVGDSIFPGQSVPAVTLGGLRVAQSILNNSRRKQAALRRPLDIKWESN